MFWALSVALVLCIFLVVRLGQEYHANLKFQLLNDALTELPNRRGLEEELERILPAAEAKGERVALLFIALDGFRQVNDLYGHRTGDAFLKQIGVRIKSRLKRGDILARVGGDEFAVVSREAGEREPAALADPILDVVRGCSNVDSHHVDVSASIGISLFSQHGTDGPTLIRHADLAMRKSKRERGDAFQIYEPGMSGADFRSAEIVAMIRRALDNNGLHLVFQPVVDGGGRVVKMEALVRIHDVLVGSIPPDEFMGVAEQTGLIHEMGDWIFRAVCRQARGWHDDGHRIPVTVNVSPAQLELEDFGPRVLGHLEAAGLPASALVIEVTEDCIRRGAERAAATFRTLRASGVRISLDDFGVGCEELQVTADLPVDSIKMDKSWMGRLVGNSPGRIMAAAAVDKARRLGYRVTAKGIEEQAHLKIAREIGCDLFQGFLIAPPLEAEDATLFMEGHVGAVSAPDVLTGQGRASTGSRFQVPVPDQGFVPAGSDHVGRPVR